MGTFVRGLCLLLLVPTLGCSGEDDEGTGKGSGLGAGASSGAGGSGNLAVGGRAGAAGKAGAGGASGAGAAGLAGASGTSGSSGSAGSGGTAGDAGAAGAAGTGGSSGTAGSGGGGGDAGASGGGEAGSGGSSGAAGSGGAALRASTAVCGNGKLEPGERCDGLEGTTDSISCADILNDPKATGTPSCVSCFPSFEGCVSCKNGKKDGDETDLDCGGAGGCSRCELGLACQQSADCAPTLACVGGVCNQITVEVAPAVVRFAPTGAHTRVPLVVRGAIPLPPTATVALTNALGTTLGSASPTDPTRLVALVPTGSPGVLNAQLLLDGHPFAVALPRAEAQPTGTRTITAISGRLGACASAPPNVVPLAFESVATGPSPALELPVGRPFCLRVKSSTALQFPVEVFLGGTAVGKVGGQEISPTELELDFVVPPTPLFEARNGNTPIELAVRFGAQSMAASAPLTVLSPFTTRVGASGAGTTSSPAAPTFDFAAMGAPFAQRTVWQIVGPHPLPTKLVLVPNNLVIQGTDQTASLDQTTIGASLNFQKNNALRDLTVLGLLGPTGALTGTCLGVTIGGTGNWLHDVTLRRCQKGIHLANDTSLLMAGVSNNGMGDVSGALSSEGGAFTGIDVQMQGVTPATGNAVDGFQQGKLTLVRSTLASFQNGISGGASANVSLHASTVDVNLNALRLVQGGTARIVGGTLKLPGAVGQGVSVGAAGVFEGRGFQVVGAGDSGLSVGGGELDVTAVVLSACGGSNTAAVTSSANGSFVAHGLRIEQPGQIGIFALKDNGSLSLTDTIIEGSTERSLWIFGGTTKLRSVLLLDPQREGLSFGDPAEPLDALDLDIVKHQPSESPDSLVFASRAASPTDVVSFRHLRAGDGADLASVPGKPVCATLLEDPVGGRYIEANGNTEPMCF